MNRHQRDASESPSSDLHTAMASTPRALYEAALHHMRAGRYLDAQACCTQALALDAAHTPTMHLMGLLLLQARQYDHAVEWLAQAIRLDPRTEYLEALGTTLQHQGRFQDALGTFDKAIQLKPHDAGLWGHLGNVLIQLERPADALLSFQRALELDPRCWDAAFKSGLLLHQSGRLDEAVLQFDLCDKLQPDHAQTLHMRARSLRDAKRFEEALTDSRRVHVLDPANADACNNIGAILQWLGRYEEALPWFDRAFELLPTFVGALTNKAVALSQMHRFDEVRLVYRRVMMIDPNDAKAELGLAHQHLLTGDFANGWPGREARWKATALPAYPEFTQPRWHGEDIAGRTILIFTDEGLGDSIQFARYATLLAQRGARVILAADDPLRPLLSDLSGVAHCVSKSVAELPAFDIHCPMSSLPMAFGTRLETIPSQIPYLPPPEAARTRAWEARLGPRDRLRVGIVWSGNPIHTNDHNRSIPLRVLSRMLDADATFVSLQKDPRPADRETLAGRSDIIDLTAHLTDFAETAALLCCLDLVITVDTSIAHLSGALGRPTWILLPYTPDWRWLLDRDDSPWYPTVRLFRQTESRDYVSVIDRVRTELRARAAAFGGVDR